MKSSHYFVCKVVDIFQKCNLCEKMKQKKKAFYHHNILYVVKFMSYTSCLYHGCDTQLLTIMIANDVIPKQA